MRWYDAPHNRLIYKGKPATPQFWDTLWQGKRDLAKEVTSDRTDPLIPTLTRRFIPVSSQAKIIDGGCGIGQHVARLQRLGYDAYGVDSDHATVERVKQAAPHLNITAGDVRALPYPDNFFDGYWSIGVIEHWLEGYEACAQEMWRVLKPGGYLFLTFPHMSLLRRLKATVGAYPTAPTTIDPATFYQFALDGRAVATDFTKLGFVLRLRTTTAGFKGLKDESGSVQPLLQRFYDNRSIVARGIRVVISWLLNPIAGHSVVLVFQKQHA